MDSADPLEGWSFEEFLSSPSPARNDIYGSLYFYLQEQFRTFCQRLGNLQVHFQLFKLDAIDLPRVLKGRGVGERYFDRIEVQHPSTKNHLSILLMTPRYPTSEIVVILGQKCFLPLSLLTSRESYRTHTPLSWPCLSTLRMKILQYKII